VSSTAGSFTVIVGGSRAARAAAVADALRAAGGAARRTSPARWPFLRDPAADVAEGCVALEASRLDEAFPAGQAGSTRLVLTQSSYQLQRWLDWIDRRGNAAIVAEANASALFTAAPESSSRRGPWSRVELVQLPEPSEPGSEEPAQRPEDPLERAFHTTDASERLALCRRAVDAAPDDPVARLALGSAFMEVQDLDASQAAIERAVAAAADWEAAYYELGKLLLRRDDLEGAGRAFAEAGRLMPSFSAAFSNLGATLGELDRPAEALRAFEQALKHDPAGFPLLNNIGVVLRELGRLAESEAALRKVISAAPDFVFGHYNLGHTLFLQGRYQAALAAYEGGQRRDPEKNPRQACRLAVVRLAAGDADGSLRDLQRCAANLANDEKREIFAEAQEILWALLADRPGLAGWRRVADVVKAELDGI
jgi:tetratricopeptide (TPR) repeat protein